MGFSSHDDFTQPVRFRSRGTNEVLKKRWPRRPGKTPYRTTQLWPTMLTLTFHNFQLVMCFFFPSFFEPERELQLQVFTVMITKQIIPILFTEACLTKAKKCFGRNNTTIHASWKRQRIQFVGCHDSCRASFDWQGEIIFTSFLIFTTSILWGESLRKSARNLQC